MRVLGYFSYFFVRSFVLVNSYGIEILFVAQGKFLLTIDYSFVVVKFLKNSLRDLLCEQFDLLDYIVLLLWMVSVVFDTFKG